MAQGDTTTISAKIVDVTNDWGGGSHGTSKCDQCWQSDRDPSIIVHYINGVLETTDGETCDFSVGTNPKYVDGTFDRIDKLVGNDIHSLSVEDRGEFQGIQQFKILDYPGKPQPRGGGGGGGGQRRDSGGGGGKKGGDWETADERWEKNRSIEAQVASDRAVQLVAATAADLGFDDALKLVEKAIPIIAAAIRGAVAEARKERVPTEQGPAPETDGSKTDRVTTLNALLTTYKTKNKIKAAWEDEFGGEAPEVENMTVEELDKLLTKA